MAAVTIHSDFGAQEVEICHCFHLFSFYLPWSDGTGCHELHFLNVKSAFSLSPFNLIKKFFHSTLLSAIRVVSSSYLRFLIFLPVILIPACNSFSPAFYMMCSAYNLNKQGNNKQPCSIPFSILNQSVVPNNVLVVPSWSTYRFLRRQERWSGIPISLIICQGLLWSTQPSGKRKRVPEKHLFLLYWLCQNLWLCGSQ